MSSYDTISRALLPSIIILPCEPDFRAPLYTGREARLRTQRWLSDMDDARHCSSAVRVSTAVLRRARPCVARLTLDRSGSSRGDNGQRMLGLQCASSKNPHLASFDGTLRSIDAWAKRMRAPDSCRVGDLESRAVRQVFFCLKSLQARHT